MTAVSHRHTSDDRRGVADQQQQQQADAAAIALPQHPGHLVLPSNFLKQLNAIRIAGGAVVWMDVVTKVNKVKRQQQRLVIITETHLYACLPDDGDIQRCLPLAAITAAHVHIPANACIGGSSQANGGNNRRRTTVFASTNGGGGLGNSYGSGYGGFNASNGSAGGMGSSSFFNSGLVGAKCEVLLLCPSEYDLLIFVNDGTFRHFLSALTAAQEAVGNSFTTTFSSPSSAVSPAGSFAGAGAASAAASNSFYTVPVVEVPQPIMQTPALMGRARLEKPPKYSRTKAARFVTKFTKLVAPQLPPMPGDGGLDDGSDAASDDNSLLGDCQQYHSADRSRAGSQGSIDFGTDDGVGPSPSSPHSDHHYSREASHRHHSLHQDASLLLENNDLKRMAARQRAMSLKIPLPDASGMAAMEQKKADALVQEASIIAGRVDIPDTIVAGSSGANGTANNNDDDDDELLGSPTSPSSRGATNGGSRMLPKRRSAAYLRSPNNTGSRANEDDDDFGGTSTYNDSFGVGGGGGGGGNSYNNNTRQPSANADEDELLLGSGRNNITGGNSGYDSDDLLAEMDEHKRRLKEGGGSMRSRASPDDKEVTRWSGGNSANANTPAGNNRDSKRATPMPQQHVTLPSPSGVMTPNNNNYADPANVSMTSDGGEGAKHPNQQQPQQHAHSNSSSNGPIGTRDGWLGVVKAHKAQNDALRRIIADLQVQMNMLSRENAALRATNAALTGGGDGGAASPSRFQAADGSPSFSPGTNAAASLLSPSTPAALDPLL